MAKCGAKTRSGEPCKNWAIRGRTRCKFHGGKSPRGKESKRYTHGAYSVEVTDRVKRLRQLASDILSGDASTVEAVATIASEMAARHGDLLSREIDGMDAVEKATLMRAIDSSATNTRQAVRTMVEADSAYADDEEKAKPFKASITIAAPTKRTK